MDSIQIHTIQKCLPVSYVVPLLLLLLLTQLIHARLQNSALVLRTPLRIDELDGIIPPRPMPSPSPSPTSRRSRGFLCVINALPDGGRGGLEEVHLDEHLVLQVDVALQDEAAPAQRLDEGRDVGLVALVVGAVDFDGQRRGFFFLLTGAPFSVLGFALSSAWWGGLSPVSDAVVDGRAVAVAFAAEGAEAALDLGDPELALPVQDAVGLLDEVEPVGAHEGETEDDDVDAAVVEGQVGDVGFGDERARALQVVAADVELQLLLLGLQRLGQLGVAAPQVRERADVVGAW